MKKFRVYDLYENYGVIGEFNTYAEACAAAALWREETAGECDTVILEWSDIYQAYTAIEKKIPAPIAVGDGETKK